jgi:hypothetical protein
MENTAVSSVPVKKRRQWIKITTRVLVVVLLLWVIFVGYMWRIMHRSPEGFARVMMHLPWEVFLICPFETMWTHARAGTVKVGDPAPDFTLKKLDKNGNIHLAELNQGQPVVLVFGSYT